MQKGEIKEKERKTDIEIARKRRGGEKKEQREKRKQRMGERK